MTLGLDQIRCVDKNPALRGFLLIENGHANLFLATGLWHL